MSNQKVSSNTPVAATVALILAELIGVAALPAKELTGSALATQKEKGETEVRMPVAVYSAQLPSDPVERAIRIARSGRFDKRYPVPFDELSPDTKGRSEISDWYVYMPALPATESDAIVLGEVTSTNGYVSSDRTGAYSEFIVQISDVLKDDGRQSVRSITAVREGADVQLPDGRIVSHRIAHQGRRKSVDAMYSF